MGSCSASSGRSTASLSSAPTSSTTARSSECGALSSTRLRQRLSAEWIVRIASVGLGLGAAGAALSPALLLTLPCLALAGAGWVLALWQRGRAAWTRLSMRVCSPKVRP